MLADGGRERAPPRRRQTTWMCTWKKKNDHLYLSFFLFILLFFFPLWDQGRIFVLSFQATHLLPATATRIVIIARCCGRNLHRDVKSIYIYIYLIIIFHQRTRFLYGPYRRRSAGGGPPATMHTSAAGGEPLPLPAQGSGTRSDRRQMVFNGRAAGRTNIYGSSKMDQIRYMDLYSKPVIVHRRFVVACSLLFTFYLRPIPPASMSFSTCCCLLLDEYTLEPCIFVHLPYIFAWYVHESFVHLVVHGSSIFLYTFAGSTRAFYLLYKIVQVHLFYFTYRAVLVIGSAAR